MTLSPGLLRCSKSSKKAIAGKNIDFDEDSETGLSQSDELVEGPALVLESEHPYSHNRNEYTTVGVPGAGELRDII